MKDLDNETIQNRQAAMELLPRQAMRGDKIAGGLFALKSLAGQVPGGNYIANTMQDYGNECEEDDFRPY